MIVAMTFGFFWSGPWRIPIPAPMNDFLAILGGAATPGGVDSQFGALLATKSGEKLQLQAGLLFASWCCTAVVALAALVGCSQCGPYKAGVISGTAAARFAGKCSICSPNTHN